MSCCADTTAFRLSCLQLVHRGKTACVWRVRQGVLHVVVSQHSPTYPLRREAAPVSHLWQAVHRLVQPLLPPHDTQQGQRPKGKGVGGRGGYWVYAVEWGERRRGRLLLKDFFKNPSHSKLHPSRNNKYVTTITTTASLSLSFAASH